MFGRNPIRAGKINLEVRDWVKPGDVVVVALDDLRLRVETTDLSERDVPNVKPGQKVSVFVKPAGKREILGVSVSTSEPEVHWRAFLENLKQHGLGGVQLTLAPHASAGVTSDDHAGLRAARLAVFGGLPWQRCQFYLQQNAQAYVPRKDMQAEVAADLRTIFDAPDRTTKGVERLHREVRHRACAVSIFPNSVSCLRLVSAVLAEISEEWLTGRTYINFEGATELTSQGLHVTQFTEKPLHYPLLLVICAS